MGFRNTFRIYGLGSWNRLVKTRKVKNRHLLLIQLSGLGDACTLIPFAKQLQNDGYTLDIAVRSSFIPLWKEFTNFRYGFPIGGKVPNAPMNDSGTCRLNDLAYEAVFSTSVNIWGAFLASLPKTDMRAGMLENGHHYTGSHLYTHCYNAGVNEHVTSRFFHLFRLCLSRFQMPVFQETVPHSGEGILLHPGGKWKPRRWPANRYWELACRLARQGWPVSVLVHASEPDLLKFFQNQPKQKNVRIVQSKTLEQLINRVRRCRLFVGNDSGPGHLAGLLGRPAVLLWGPGNLKRIRPQGDQYTLIVKPVDCRPCRQYVYPDRCERGQPECLLQIETEEVEKAVLNRLGNR